jgi:predicted nuclease of predicted toxin-antitoxin system
VRVRFHLDENISFGVAAGLRRRSIDVTCSTEVGLAGARDLEQLHFATRSGSVPVTHDADFLRLHASGSAHAGIAYWYQGSLTVGEILRRLVLIHDVLTPDEIVKRIEFL